jgi:hypothetical protein
MFTSPRFTDNIRFTDRSKFVDKSTCRSSITMGCFGTNYRSFWDTCAPKAKKTQKKASSSPKFPLPPCFFRDECFVMNDECFAMNDEYKFAMFNH